jgi:hypothetical protein
MLVSLPRGVRHRSTTVGNQMYVDAVLVLRMPQFERLARKQASVVPAEENRNRMSQNMSGKGI